MGSVLVFVESQGGTLKKPSLEALGEGARIAKALGVPLRAVAAGPAAAEAAQAAARLGPDRVWAMASPALARFTPEAYGRALAAAAKAADASLVLLGATAMGKDLAPAAAARLGTSPVSDCTGASVVGGKVLWRRPVYAGRAYATVEGTGPVTVASLRPNAFSPGGAPGAAAPVETLDPGVPPSDVRTVAKEVLAPAAKRVDLTEADIVVSGGRGLRGPENFHLVEELAAALGAVVDAGWRPHSEQVGQTGKTVAPKLYVALGISGAIQHLAGMSSSRCIVAVNRDAEAPIFKVADYGVVGDVFEIAPALTKAVLALKGG